MLHIVLVEPEIPQNTGNIARTCAATGSVLHLVEPLGYSLSDRYLKRAGLDYWRLVQIHVHPNFEALEAHLAGIPMYFTSVRGCVTYADVAYPEEVALVFGRESRGLPQAMLDAQPGRCVRLPMVEGARSLNLSNTVAIMAYEVQRQRGFRGLQTLGGHQRTRCPEWSDYV